MLIDSSLYLLFVTSALALLITPGPVVIYIVTRSLAQGRRAGLVSAAGAVMGGAVHLGLALIGVSTLLLTSSTAFRVVQFAGAGYLIFLGVKTLWGGRKAIKASPEETLSDRGIFAQGFLVNVLNPKAALFFAAFLPQFVNLEAGRIGEQLLMLGLTFLGLGLITDTGYALLAGNLGRRWLASGSRPWGRWLAGTVYIGLGVAAAFSGSTRK